MRNSHKYLIYNVFGSILSTIVFYFSFILNKFDDYNIENLIICISVVTFIMVPIYSISYSYGFDNKKCFKKRVEIYKLLKNNDDIIPLLDDFLIYNYNNEAKKYLMKKLIYYLGNTLIFLNTILMKKNRWKN